MDSDQQRIAAALVSRDYYELAGLSTLHPSVPDVLARLVEFQQSARSGKRGGPAPPELLRKLDDAVATFEQPATAAKYRERLATEIVASFRAVAASGGKLNAESLKKQLRIQRNVHPSQIEPLIYRIFSRDEPEPEHPTPIAVPATPTTVKPQQPAPVRPSARVVQRKPIEHDPLALLWIIGPALITAITICVVALFFFRERLWPKRSSATSQQATTSEEPMQTVPFREEPDPPPIEPAPKSSSFASKEPPAANADSGEASEGPMSKPQTPAASPEESVEKTPASAAANPPSTPMPSPAAQTVDPNASGSATAAPPAASGVIEFGKRVNALAWDEAGVNLAIVGEGNELWVGDLEKEQPKRWSGAFNECLGAAFSSSPMRLGLATDNSELLIWEHLGGKQEKRSQPAQLGSPRSLQWFPAGNPACWVLGDGKGAIWFLDRQGAPINMLDAAVDAGSALAIALPGSASNHLLSGHLDGSVVAWSTKGNKRKPTKCLTVSGSSLQTEFEKSHPEVELTFWPHAACHDVRWHPQQSAFAAAVGDLEIRDFERAPASLRRRLLPGSDEKSYRLVRFSPGDGALLAAGRSDSTLVLIDVKRWIVLLEQSYSAPISALEWNPKKARRLAVGLENGQVHVVQFTDDVMKLWAEPDFDPEKLLKSATEKADGEEWSDCMRLITVLCAYKLPSAKFRDPIDALRGKARKAIEEQIQELAKRPPLEEVSDAVDLLQLAYDIDPNGRGGAAALSRLRSLPTLTPENLAQAAAKASVQTTSPGKKK